MSKNCKLIVLRAIVVKFLLVSALVIVDSPVVAQNGGNQQQGGAGIEIDAQGVLRAKRLRPPHRELVRARIRAAKATLNRNLTRPSRFRKISLNRLEAAIKKKLAENKKLDPSMLYLAGLTRVTHVFYFPSTSDIVIAGPAEGFFQDQNGNIVGTESGHATLRLEDLVVALRAFAPRKEPTTQIMVSIDPTPQGLRQLNQVVQKTTQHLKAQGGLVQGQERQVAKAYREALGYQTITIKGVSPKSHFAQVMVEADYRMKLIGIGLEQPPVRMATFAEKVRPSQAGNGGLVRWYFEPNYECIEISEDENAMRLVGSGVKLVGQDERVTQDGKRHQHRRVNGASRAYTRSFTKNYDKIADKHPVYAKLRNLMDLAIVAAFIQEMKLYEKSNWKFETLGNESKFSVERYSIPKKIEPAINAFWKGRTFMTPIGGGVSIRPRHALAADRLKQDTQGEVKSARNSIKLDQLREDQWWWD